MQYFCNDNVYVFIHFSHPTFWMVIYKLVLNFLLNELETFKLNLKIAQTYTVFLLFWLTKIVS
jgi:hypothetical protein